MHLKQGTLLQGGKYKIKKCLGQGSFGITYLAKMKSIISGGKGQTCMWVDVAIKEFFMKDFNSRQPDGSLNETTGGTIVEKYKKDFKREADNLSRMNHHGVVDILDTFEENNTCYLVMAYIDGESLDAYISKNGAMPEKEALTCFEQIADALHYMHCQHMLHLDLKPRNIMRDSENKTFVIDFGLSKQYDDNDEPESSTTLGQGTQGYAPLEQGAPHSGHDFPVTIDVYALGATLYKMLTAQTPPHAAILLSSPEIVNNALTAKGVSKSTMSIILKALSPRKENRYKNVASFMKAFGWTAKDYPQEIIHAEVVKILTEEKTTVESKKEQFINSETKKHKHSFGISSKKIVLCGFVSIIFLIHFLYLRFIGTASNDYDDDVSNVVAVDSITHRDSTTDAYNSSKWVDLGLSVKWASCNVGATYPGEMGNYYTHYFSDELEEGSRVPTKEDFQELSEKCEWKWTNYNGYPGYKVSGSNGNSIFLPAAGVENAEDKTKSHFTEIGCYWISNVREILFDYFSFDNNNRGFNLHIEDEAIHYKYEFGRSLRLILDD